MKLDPNTCLYQAHGFELYRHEGKPLVVHRYSKRRKGEKGEPIVEKFVEHLDLDGEHWPETQTAAEVRIEMKQALADWLAWNEANGRATMKKAFTLVELMIVIAIVGIIAVIALAGCDASKPEAAVEPAPAFKYQRIDPTMSGPNRAWLITDTATGQRWIAVENAGVSTVGTYIVDRTHQPRPKREEGDE